MGRIDKESIGYRQQLIMQCVWEAGSPITVQEIIDRLEVKCGQRFAMSTINTLVQILVERDLLAQGTKIRQAFTYYALISEEEFRIRELKRFEKLTFGGSASVLLTGLVQTGISKEEIKKMKEILDQIDE